MEIIGFDLVEAQPPIRFILFYRPPDYDSTAERVASTFVELVNEYAICNDKRHIIVGDLNLPHINWNDLTCPTDSVNSVIVDFVINNGFSQLVNFNTRYNSLLDVVLTDDNLIVSNLDSHPPIGLSDHVIIEFDVVLTFKVYSDPNANYNYKSKHLWHDADYDSMSMYLSCIDWSSVCCYNPSALSLWNAFSDILSTAVSLFVPIRHPTRSTNYTGCIDKPVISKTMHKCAIQKRRIWRKMKSHPTDIVLQNKYHNCVLEWRRHVRAKQTTEEERIIHADSLGAFYQFVNKRTANRRCIGVILDENGSLLTSSYDKANAFNKYFSSVSVIDNNFVPSCLNVQLNSILDTMVISESDVIRSIRSLKNKSSSGPDGLPPTLFKRLKYVLCRPLTTLFNQLISVGEVPLAWKGAFIVPVYKKRCS